MQRTKTTAKLTRRELGREFLIFPCIAKYAFLRIVKRHVKYQSLKKNADLEHQKTTEGV